MLEKLYLTDDQYFLISKSHSKAVEKKNPDFLDKEKYNHFQILKEDDHFKLKIHIVSEPQVTAEQIDSNEDLKKYVEEKFCKLTNKVINSLLLKERKKYSLVHKE